MLAMKCMLWFAEDTRIGTAHVCMAAQYACAQVVAITEPSRMFVDQALPCMLDAYASNVICCAAAAG